jgi:hypothetical protein
MIAQNRCIALKNRRGPETLRAFLIPTEGPTKIGRAEKLPEREILHKGFFEGAQFETLLLF